MDFNKFIKELREDDIYLNTSYNQLNVIARNNVDDPESISAVSGIPKDLEQE